MYAFPSMHTHPDWYPAIVELEMTGFQQFGFLKVNWARCRISSLLGLRCSYMYVSKWQWAPHDLSSGKKSETLRCCGKILAMIILHWFDYECDRWKYLVKANYPLSDDIFPYLPNDLVDIYHVSSCICMKINQFGPFSFWFCAVVVLPYLYLQSWWQM